MRPEQQCEYCSRTFRPGVREGARTRRFCSQRCAYDAMTAQKAVQAVAWLAAVERLLDEGLDPDDVAQSMGTGRKHALRRCRESGRPDLAHRLARRPGRPPIQESHAVCGTDAGYQAHRAKREEACLDCRRANATVKASRAAIARARTVGPAQITNPTRDDWSKAACRRNGDPDDWFPDPTEWDKSHRAKMTCLTKCVLRQACLQMALESDKDWANYGIYGGLAAHERTRLKRRSKAA